MAQEGVITVAYQKSTGQKKGKATLEICEGSSTEKGKDTKTCKVCLQIQLRIIIVYCTDQLLL